MPKISKKYFDLQKIANDAWGTLLSEISNSNDDDYGYIMAIINLKVAGVIKSLLPFMDEEKEDS